MVVDNRLLNKIIDHLEKAGKDLDLYSDFDQIKNDEIINELKAIRIKRLDAPEGECPKFDEDKLDTIFTMQQALIDHLKKKFPGRDWEHQYLIGCMHNELEELRDSFPWKKHKENFEDLDAIDWENVRIECVDLLFFIVEFMILIPDMDAKECFLLYKQKHDENIKRYENGY